MIDSGNNRITGIILDICDGIISVSGLNDASVGELISFKDRSCEISGFILNSESDICRIPIIRGNESDIKVGDIVYRTNKLINARCGFGVLGEIIDPLGNTILTSKTDTVDLCLSNLFNTTWSAIEVAAPGIINRSPIRTPLMTGVSSIDSFIPIGCGQRELIIGDHNTGKTSLAITAIINQSEINNNICGF
jgi:F0F1-type ATP synthase alpha subunit